MRRRILPALIVPILALGACAEDSPAETPTPDEVTTAEETPTVEESESESEPTEETTTPEETESEDTGTEESASPEETDSGSNQEDLVDGVRTNDFQRMPKEVRGMAQKAAETDPQSHIVKINYEAPGGDAINMTQFVAYIPAIDGEPRAIPDMNHPDFSAAMGMASQSMAKNVTPETRKVNAGGLDWECIEGAEAQDSGKVDHAWCLTVKYGRILEVQRLSTTKDTAEWQSDTDAVLEEFGTAVNELGS